MSYVAKQPNGLYCLFSTVADCPEKWNMTVEDYINLKVQKAKEEAIKDLNEREYSFDNVVNDFVPDHNMTESQFNTFLQEVGSKHDYGYFMGDYID